MDFFEGWDTSASLQTLQHYREGPRLRRMFLGAKGLGFRGCELASTYDDVGLLVGCGFPCYAFPYDASPSSIRHLPETVATVPTCARVTSCWLRTTCVFAERPWLRLKSQTLEPQSPNPQTETHRTWSHIGPPIKDHIEEQWHSGLQ